MALEKRVVTTYMLTLWVYLVKFYIILDTYPQLVTERYA